MRDVSRVAMPTSGTRQPVDAIIVPTARRAEQLQAAIELAAHARTMLVVLGSRHSRVDEVAELVASSPGSRAMIVEMPAGYRHDFVPARSSGASFRAVSAERDSDLSVKRNVGLLLARLQGWNKIMFLDDDVIVKHADLARLSVQLDRHQTAGLVCYSFPDNSVVCHANRLRGARQDVFVTGAALGVHCADHPLPFFPDIYNEDWFFFYEAAARRSLPKVGTARQREYRPFDDPGRARREEFGDLLAEGLYAHISAGDDLGTATRDYWQDFLGARGELLESIQADLSDIETNEAVQALGSIRAASDQLARITPEHCVEFLDAWQQDQRAFAAGAAKLANVGSAVEAFDFLQLRSWRVAAFAHRDLSRTPAPLPR